MANPAPRRLGITDVVLRDGNQSLLATRMRLEDMLPIAPKLDQVGFWSVESWGGATFDACIRYLGEDPWLRIRALKKAMPNTPQQMLLRGQNLLGYRHYADDLVDKFVERAAFNGIDVFRVFDAMNDVRNLRQAINAVIRVGKHAQGTISFTTSPVHTVDLWVDLAKRIEDMGVHSLCVKDMAGLLKPYVAFELISRLKATLSVPIHMQSHATTGMATATYVKSIEAGVDNVDTAISSMSQTYGHSACESVVAILEGTERDTGFDIDLLEEIAGYFREVRRRYARFEGSMRGIDARILAVQVPGGMLTNMESQLKHQNALHRMDEVLAEIPKVRKDLGYIALVTPTSQIVGTQAVLNVLAGERYRNIANETVALVRGEYGQAPAPFDPEVAALALNGQKPITCRPADLLRPEFDRITSELVQRAERESFSLMNPVIDDVLTYALFPQVALHFFKHRGDSSAFEQPVMPPSEEHNSPLLIAESTYTGPVRYNVVVDGRTLEVEVLPDMINEEDDSPQFPGAVKASLAGAVVKLLVEAGATVKENEPVLVLEAMKMETQVPAPKAGTIGAIHVAVGDAIRSGQALFSMAEE